MISSVFGLTSFERIIGFNYCLDFIFPTLTIWKKKKKVDLKGLRNILCISHRNIFNYTTKNTIDFVYFAVIFYYE